jgi:hypothetical protein
MFHHIKSEVLDNGNRVTLWDRGGAGGYCYQIEVVGFYGESIHGESIEKINLDDTPFDSALRRFFDVVSELRYRVPYESSIPALR